MSEMRDAPIGVFDSAMEVLRLHAVLCARFPRRG